jgi:hypothetical protein
MTIWFLCIIPLLAVGSVSILSCCSAQRRLMRKIRKRRLKSLWWVHRHKAHQIELTSQTTVRKPRQMRGEYNIDSAVILNHFWLDGHLKKSDTFLVKNLYEKKPT